MSHRSNVERRLSQAEKRLSASRVAILSQILASSEETFYLSARQLAKRYQVDPATISRIVRQLGYDSFEAFSEDLRAHFVQAVTPFQTFSEDVSGLRTNAENIQLSFTRAMQNLAAAGRENTEEAFLTAGARISGARSLLLVGADMLYSPAFHLQYGLNVLGIAAHAPQQIVAMTYAARALGREDVLVVFGFRRTLKVCAETAALARQRGAYIIGITDHPQSLVGRVADAALIVSISSPVFTSSLAAVMAVVEALLMSCAFVGQPQSSALLKMVDDDYRHGDRWFRDDIDAYITALPPKAGVD